MPYKKAKKIRKRRTADPDVIHVIHVRRGASIHMPDVNAHKDFNAPGLVRVLDRKDDKFPEFALYPRAKNHAKIEKSLRNAGLKMEERGKWVLRTDRFNIFVYV